MNATDRLRQAAQKIRETVHDATPGSWQVGKSWAGDLTVMGDIGQPIAVVASDHVAALDRSTQADAALIALMANPPMALLIADWLEDIAADKDSGLGTIHPRAFDVTNLILGGDQ